jgi:hypothetical protein
LLKRRVRPLIAPCKEMTIQMNLLEGNIVKEVPELSHEPTILATVIPVLRLVDQVDVSG